MRVEHWRIFHFPFSIFHLNVGVTANGTNHFVTVGSNTSEVVFQRIHPDDFDFDGLPNALDPNPYQPEANAGFNQTDAWAMLAFPSNATEIAALGYVDWAGLRSFEPNRRQISLWFGSEMNAWPACLTFGDVQVMCDGTEEVFFAFDCGAHYAFSMPGCELAGVWLYGVWCTWFGPDWWYGPYETNLGDVTIHLDTMGSGWIGTTAEVSVDGLDGSHFFPNDSKNVTAVVTNCHEDAYIDCTWSGGDGVTFSNRHSLTTTVGWHSSDSVEWATNYVDLVTTYKGGYAVTNHCAFTVGTQTEPTPAIELICPTNMFLNSILYSNYVERIYPASVKVAAPHGIRGRLCLDVDANSGIRLYADRERTAGMPQEIAVEISEVGEYGTNVSFFVTCPYLGTGRIQASLFLTDGTEKNAHVDVLIIEPERRLVMDEHDERTGIIVNPSRLVYGTNAVLKVGVHQAGHAFNPMHYTEGNCIELYFVGRIIPANVKAFYHERGIVIAKDLKDKRLVAHEIGHAFGLSDCYVRNDNKVQMVCATEPVGRGTFESTGRDWGDETSHGFYTAGDTNEEVLRKLLMCGYLDLWDMGGDIPDNWILSLEKKATRPDQIFRSSVGARQVESKTNQEIYSK